MKEHPILFTGEMVRAILAGTKTQTRRTSGLKEINKAPDRYRLIGIREVCGVQTAVFVHKITGNAEFVRCCYGTAGARLWAKETFMHVHEGLLQSLDPDPDSAFWSTHFRADGEQSEPYTKQRGFIWKPSIFMPRKLSRITLENTGVRFERLHEITEADAKAEGVTFKTVGFNDPRAGGKLSKESYVEGYGELWESINGAGSWALNPWVQVVDFKRIGGGK